MPSHPASPAPTATRYGPIPRITLQYLDDAPPRPASPALRRARAQLRRPTRAEEVYYAGLVAGWAAVLVVMIAGWAA